MMEIKILGGGCPNCTILYNNVNSACRELKFDAKILKIQDYEDRLKGRADTAEENILKALQGLQEVISLIISQRSAIGLNGIIQCSSIE